MLHAQVRPVGQAPLHPRDDRVLPAPAGTPAQQLPLLLLLLLLLGVPGEPAAGECSNSALLQHMGFELSDRAMST